MTRTKASLTAAAATLLAVLGMAGMPAPSVPVVRTAVVEQGELVQSILLSGTVRYRQEQPCLSLKNGRVAAVYAQAGQTVQKGDLLIRLDCTAEEEMLAACIRANHQREKLGVMAAAMTPQAQLMAQARAGVAASQIRADADGIVEAVYIQPGSYVQQGDVVGWMRSDEKCVMAAGAADRIGGVRAGAAAVLDTGEKLMLRSIGAPTAENLQQLEFTALEADSLAGCAAGKRVAVELLCGTESAGALVPLSAVSGSQRIWFVEDGKVWAAKIDTDSRNAAFVAAPGEWIGRSVVLAPDETVLVHGCAVREAEQE